MKNYLRAGVTIFVLSISVFSQNDPRGLIIQKDVELRKAISAYSKQPSDAARENLKKLTFGLFDFQVISKNVVPKAVWDTCSEKSRAAFISAFKNMVEQSAVSKIEMYQADSTFYDSLAATANDNASLKAHLWKKGREQILVYKFLMVADVWKISDLLINDLSTVRSYKEQFTVLFKTKNMAEVTGVLVAKCNSGTVAK